MATPSSDLNHLNLVITRPIDQGKKWQKKLQPYGIDCHLIPVLEINPLSDTAQKNQLKTIILQLDEFQKIIFVSQNAVREAAKWVDDFWPQRPVGLEYFAVGSATAALASEKDFTVSSPNEAMNSEALLKLEGLQHVEGEKILIFRGVGGREHLGKQLTDKGATVTYGELYTRDMPQQALAEFREFKVGNQGRKTVLSAHSGESVQNLADIFSALEKDHNSEQPSQQQSLKMLPLIVPGQRVANIAKELGFTEVLIADNATDDAMTQALIDSLDNK